MWIEKYRPQTVSEFLGNEEAKQTFLDWLRKWKPAAKGKRNRAALLYGPPGTGKTTLVRAVASDEKYTILELNASDTRTEKAIMQIAAPAARQASLDATFSKTKGTLILLDEVDGIFGREDIGGVKAIVTIIEETRTPIVLTANDITQDKLAPLIPYCILIRFHEIEPDVMLKHLRSILKYERVDVDDQILNAIIQRSKGDLRSAINDLQAVAESLVRGEKIDTTFLGYRTRGLDFQATMSSLFGAIDYAQARETLDNTDVNLYNEDLLYSIHFNLPRVYSDPEALAKAYDSVSKADIIYNRIGVQNWKLLPYALNEIAHAVILHPKKELPELFEDGARTRIGLMGARTQRQAVEEIVAKLGSRCHVSKAIARKEILPYLRIILQGDPGKLERFAAWFEIDPDRLKPLLEEVPKVPIESEEVLLLDPSGFSLPFLGNKFADVMRIGVGYNRNLRKFFLRDKADPMRVEYQLSRILGKQVKFKSIPSKIKA
jgi:replication factor C large subunit